MGHNQSRVLVTEKRKITDKYILFADVLGVGLNGKVLSCKSRETGERYALKILPNTPKSLREVELHYRSCVCPNVVQIKEVFEARFNREPSLLVVMECMKGGELFDHIIQRRHSSTFTEQDAVVLVRQICTAVAYLHKLNIAHRDLKPENLLFSDTSPNAVLKLTDFGFAKEMNSRQLLTPCYTPYYVAPEVLSSQPYDKSCDIWSLGVITYILLSGYPPFNSSNGAPISPGMKNRIRLGQFDFPEREWKNISWEAKDLIKKVLTVDPQKRLTIDEVIQHPWISQFQEVPHTPLATAAVLHSDKNVLRDTNHEMRSQLAAMRIEPEETINLKPMPNADNAILRKRRKAWTSKMIASNNNNSANPQAIKA